MFWSAVPYIHNKPCTPSFTPGSASVGLPTGARLFTIPALLLESGEVLSPAIIAYHTYGTLNAARDNAVLVGHTLTSSSAVHEWFSPLCGEGPGFALNTTREYIICVNILGSPYGSSSPLTARRAAAAAAASGAQCPTSSPAAFPKVTVCDNAVAIELLLGQLGVASLAAAVGGSLGGMLVLEFAALYPQMLRSLVVIAGSASATAWTVAASAAQRAAVAADPRWRGGAYCEGDDPPVDGLAAARQMATLLYRSPAGLQKRFAVTAGDAHGKLLRQPTAARAQRAPPGTPPQEDRPPPPGRRETDDELAVAAYFAHAGESFVRRFDAACYVALTHTLDSHHVSNARLAALTRVPALVLAVDSDMLYPLEHQAELASALPRGRLHVLRSEHGHDGFLIEGAAVNALVAAFRREVAEEETQMRHEQEEGAA